MEKVFLAAAALTVTAGAALAADLPSHKAEPILPPPPLSPIWTGFYAGLNAGYDFGTNQNVQSIGLDDVAIFDRATGTGGVGQAISAWLPHNQNGFIGGGQIGYNYQWRSSFIIGIEADMQGSLISGSSQGLGVGIGTNWAPVFVNSMGSLGATTVNAGLDWLGSFRGRFGYLCTPAILVYATGGLT